MRLFVGLAVDPAVKDILERLMLRLRSKDDGLRWSTPDQWHVTLAFLGELDDSARSSLTTQLATIHQPGLQLRLEHLGVFERVGILHGSVEVTPALQRLHEAVVDACRRSALHVEDRPFRAHITLARSRNRIGRMTLDRLRRQTEHQRIQASWRAAEFLLYESRSSPTGSTYVVQQSFALTSEELR